MGEGLFDGALALGWWRKKNLAPHLCNRPLGDDWILWPFLFGLHTEGQWNKCIVMQGCAFLSSFTRMNAFFLSKEVWIVLTICSDKIFFLLISTLII